MKSRILWWVPRARPLVRLARVSLILTFICGLLAASANAAPFVYVVTLTQQFGTIDLANGKFQPTANGTADGLSNLVWWRGSLRTHDLSHPRQSCKDQLCARSSDSLPPTSAASRLRHMQFP